MNIFVDVESVGLMGPVMRVQYAIDDGPIVEFNTQHCGRGEDDVLRDLSELTILLASEDNLFIAHNAGFDLFKLYQLLHELLYGSLMSRKNVVPAFRCNVLDTAIHAGRSGPLSEYSNTGAAGRSVARVNRIPLKAAERVTSMVRARLRTVIPSGVEVKVKRRKIKGSKDLCSLSFSVSTKRGLKAIMQSYGFNTINIQDVWPLMPKKVEAQHLPYYEHNMDLYAPYIAECKAIATGQDPRSAGFNKYSKADVLMLRILFNKLGCPTPDEDDGCVAAVAYTRYAGIKLDLSTLRSTIKYYKSQLTRLECKYDGNLRKASVKLLHLRSADVLIFSASRESLDVIEKSDSPAAKIARDLKKYGALQQRLAQAIKISESATGRLHPAFVVDGTATRRMRATGGINTQGIPQAIVNPAGRPIGGVRHAVITDFVGDFCTLEVGISAAAYRCKALQADLDNKIDLHSKVATVALRRLLPDDITYEVFVANKETNSKFKKVRKIAKGIVFGIIYGASAMKVASLVGCSTEEAEGIINAVLDAYPGIKNFKSIAARNFCTADTRNWTKESVSRMQDHVTDLLGSTRSFAFEKKMACAMWALGQSDIRLGFHGAVIRTPTKGPQSIDNAVKSAFLGSAINIQSATLRRVGNTPVQMPGAVLTKRLMHRIFKITHSPCACIHDEVYGDLGLAAYSDIAKACEDFCKEYRELVPSLDFDVCPTLRWSDKK